MKLSSTKGLSAWIATAQPGLQAIYYTGFLAADREAFYHGVRHVYPCNEMGLLAMAASDTGEFDLTQRRLGNGYYEYLITKRRWKRKV